MTVLEDVSPKARNAAGFSGAAAILAHGRNVAGEESIALWQINALGRGTGAWVIAQSIVDERGGADRALLCLRGRALTGADLTVVKGLVDRLEESASVPATGRRRDSDFFSPLAVFSDVVGRRAALEETVAAARRGGRSTAPLEWSDDLTNEAPQTVDDLRRLARLARPEGAPVVTEALSVVRVLTRLADLWTETEQPKGRRDYLAEKHGEPEPLPPHWLDASISAGVSR